jgi:hypothetical protein
LADFYLELVDAESAARSIRPASRANTPSGWLSGWKNWKSRFCKQDRLVCEGTYVNGRYLEQLVKTLGAFSLCWFAGYVDLCEFLLFPLSQNLPLVSHWLFNGSQNRGSL